MQRDFKGVWIPKEVWLASDLGWSEKLLFVEIDSLSSNGECFASNEYFAEFFDLSKDRISKLISSLKNKGYVSVELCYKPGTKQIEKRIITTIPYRRKQLEVIVENVDRGIGENNDTPIVENAEDNNTTSFINTDVINTSNIYNGNFDFEDIQNKGSQNKKITSISKKQANIAKGEKVNTKLPKDTFDTVWALYPRKEGKERAEKAFKDAVKKGVTVETIIDGIERYKRQIKAKETDTQYIKQGGTWFYNKCWQDEYDTTPLKKASGDNNPWGHIQELELPF